MDLIYSITKLSIKVLLPLLCCWEVQKEKEPLPSEPLIIVANHLSNFDIPLLGICLPRKISFMGEEELFRFPLNLLWCALGSFPVHRRWVDRKAFYKASEVLKKKGWVLGMFPEGIKSPNAQLLKAHPGAALIAFRNDAYILPVGIAGTEKVKERIKVPSYLFRRPLVTLNLGKPFKLPPVEGRPTHNQLDSFTDFIMRQLAELLPQNYRGVYKE
jgi:1-acyl-sn-glycerol-3-phosphate acyltransferase